VVGSLGTAGYFGVQQLGATMTATTCGDVGGACSAVDFRGWPGNGVNAPASVDDIVADALSALW
jgi:hypothetical protein